MTMAGIPERKVVITDNPVEGNYGEGQSVQMRSPLRRLLLLPEHVCKAML